MRFLSAFMLSLFFAGPAWAVCAVLVQDEIDACLNLGGGPACVAYDDLRNGSPALQAVDLQERLQAIVDVKQLLIGLPVDDPDRATDPDLAEIFWGDIDGKKTAILPLSETYLTSRCTVITVTADVTATAGFIIQVSNP